MQSYRICKVSDFKEDLKPIIKDVDGASIAIYRFREQYYAFINQCPHQGGPSCEGVVFPKVQIEIFERGSIRGSTSESQYNIVCPWHGVEFDLETGLCLADKRLRLKQYEVLVGNGDVSILK